MLLTVAELPEYLRKAGKLLADADRRAIVDHLAAHPAAGDLIEGTGGVRKAVMGARRQGQERRRARHRLLPQRRDAAVPADDVCEERAREPEQCRAQRAGRAGGRAGGNPA